MVRIMLLMSLFVLAGCMQVIRPEHRSQAEPGITIDSLMQNPLGYLGKKVIVGGVIVDNREDQGMSLLVIASLPLDDDLAPDKGVLPGDRFFARSADYLPPAEFGTGRFVTLFGEVIGEKTIEGKKTPLISIREIHPWDREKFSQERRWWSRDENPYGDTHDTPLKPRPLQAVPDPRLLR